MKIKLVAAAALVASFAAPAFAADEFYVAQDVKTTPQPKPTLKEITAWQTAAGG